MPKYRVEVDGEGVETVDARTEKEAKLKAFRKLGIKSMLKVKTLTPKTKVTKESVTVKFRDYITESEGLKNKAEKSGMPLGILKKVYNRGMAAWKTGHRPGTTPQQWAFARVNSFITKSKGTWGGADKDLAAKV
jgi:hypothetical protein